VGHQERDLLVSTAQPVGEQESKNHALNVEGRDGYIPMVVVMGSGVRFVVERRWLAIVTDPDVSQLRLCAMRSIVLVHDRNQNI
jgi:hypothetical protein